ncbi:MAG: hypothetical protein A2W98_00895 [Bacteroidetes bacterium GWF2_33_38]|nr:MAG: hypothetical protein A2W98_00895 [Bacteroidetes bacterium GWF2_33_38]OFY73614.1 MAG: hypothetical protein A2265_03925 [Bacteroidetes bacterium RIFOXYA12_FULL_33_9]OFY92355.1 MAG: hypothetical protein A2236_00885 [Bacteroidetes bacterium RIFOXYA2_FULL_33_7]HBX50649.1 transcriptional regulator [Bacteroidales bacterium]
MELKIIKTEEEYINAVKFLENLGDNPEFENNPKLIQEFERIEKLIKAYDKIHYPIKEGNPIEIIKLKMAYMELKPKDLVPIIGSKGLVSDVLNKRRSLSKNMIREFSKLLNISQDILITKYDLVESTKPKISRKVKFNFPSTIWSDVENFTNNILKRGAIFNVCHINI